MDAGLSGQPQGFGPLLLGGIQIYEYQPALLHAKTMFVDGVWALVGTTNLDNRSFAPQRRSQSHRA
ncbi:MAG: hypothetical protein GEU89_20955 [Kiloniellaceae bacterium]|nr:hypothetical protein [Kiloniellaceae bacterium]